MFPVQKDTHSGSGAQVWHLNVHYSPFFNGFGGFFAGSAERGWCWEGAGASKPAKPLPPPHFGASVGRPRAGGWRRGGSRIPPWHAYLARFSRVRAAMRTAPGAHKVGPDDTDELRE
eukprot:gene15940-biopygen15778